MKTLQFLMKYPPENLNFNSYLPFMICDTSVCKINVAQLYYQKKKEKEKKSNVRFITFSQ